MKFKTLNLYIKIQFTDGTLSILDVRKNGQKVSKKYWASIFRFFNSVNRDFPMGWWSPCFQYRYNGRVYNIKIFSVSIYDPGNDTKLYKMRIYK